jgi:hypothetical protein
VSERKHIVRRDVQHLGISCDAFKALRAALLNISDLAPDKHIELAHILGEALGELDPCGDILISVEPEQ